MAYSRDEALSYFGAKVVPNMLDVEHMPLYDTITNAASGSVSASTTQFFSVPLGTSGKTIAQTNLRQANKLINGEVFTVLAVRLRWAENILLADLNSILLNLAFKFTLGTETPYQQGPIPYFPAGGGINGFAMTTAATTTITAYTNGLPTREAINKLVIPIPLDSGMTFNAFLDGTATSLTASGSGGTGATFQVYLDGLWGRLKV
jgi:hypothetical protein